MKTLKQIYLLIATQVLAAVLGVVGLIIKIIIVDDKSLSLMSLDTETTRYIVYGFYILAGLFEIVAIITAFIVLFASSGTSDNSFNIEIERDDPFKT